MAYTWNERTGRYRNSATGRFVSEQSVRDLVDAVADAASERMATLSRSLLDGRLSLADWESAMLQEIKLAHLSTGVMASGGFEQMSPARYGFLGRQIRDEYAFARQFADDIASGKQPLDGRLVNRARMYGQASRSTFSSMFARDQRNRGLNLERNVLGGSEACAGCRAESARGTVPIGTLIPIGSRSPCGPNCRCRLTYSVADVAASAA